MCHDTRSAGGRLARIMEEIRTEIVLWFSVVIVIGLVALVWSADKFVEGASAIAERAGLTPMMIGLTIVSVGTSAPEILISVMSALSGSGELAVGNALGSNIANVGLVLGITLLVKSISLNKSTTFVDLPLLVLVVIVTGALLFDLALSRGDSLVLLGVLGLFFLHIIRNGQVSPQRERDSPDPETLSTRRMAHLSGGVEPIDCLLSRLSLGCVADRVGAGRLRAPHWVNDRRGRHELAGISCLGDERAQGSGGYGNWRHYWL